MLEVEKQSLANKEKDVRSEATQYFNQEANKNEYKIPQINMEPHSIIRMN